MKKENDPEFVYIHKVNYDSIICSPDSKFDGSLIVISVLKLKDDAEKVKLSSIKESCYINGYGQYIPEKIIERELTWEERRDLLTEDQLRGKVPDKNGIFRGEFGEISPFVEKIIHYWLDCHGIPRKL